MQTISFEDFQKLDLRIALVEGAEPHPNADRLVVLKIRVGDERKQIVAGIRKHYDPAELVGRKIAVVHNLAPATLRGVESQGMLLAAEDGETLALLAPDRDVAPGSRVR